jgi:ferredoxin
MFLSIDADKCMGHGRCYTLAPDLLTDDEEGFVAQRGQVVAVPPGKEDQAHDAVAACPEGAIAIRQTADA